MGVAYLVAHIYNFFFLTLRDYLTPGFDAGGQSHSHKTVYAPHRFMLGIYCYYDCERVLYTKGSGFCQIPDTREQFAQKETGHYYAFLQSRYFL